MSLLPEMVFRLFTVSGQVAMLHYACTKAPGVKTRWAVSRNMPIILQCNLLGIVQFTPVSKLLD